MRHGTIVATAAILLAAGCGKGGGGKDVSMQNASIADVTAQAKNVNKIQPGQWQTSVKMNGIEGVAMPSQASTAHTSTTCVTAKQAADPNGGMFANKIGDNCRYDNFKMADGHIDSTLSCTMPNTPGSMIATMKGTYSPTSYDIDMTSKVSGLPGGQTMTTHSTLSSKRIGDCPG